MPRRQLMHSELMWMPRGGIAYQLNNHTVLRAGYGMYFDSVNPFNVTPDATGFSRTTSTVLTNDFGVNWLAGNPRTPGLAATDPFPVRADGTRFDAPPRDTLGSMARAGRGWSYGSYDPSVPASSAGASDSSDKSARRR